MGSPGYDRFTLPTTSTGGGTSYGSSIVGFRYEASLMQWHDPRTGRSTVPGNATALRNSLSRNGYSNTSIKVAIIQGVAQMQITGRVNAYAKQDSFAYINNEITGLARQAGYSVFGSGTGSY